MANLTMIGLYNIMPELFENLTLPDGIDRETAIDTILMRSGEFEVLYSNPDFIRASLKTWSAKWYHTFDKWQKALAIEYDPLSNYDRHEEWNDKGSGKTEDDTHAHVLNKISAYDSDTMRNDNESSTEGGSKSSLESENNRKGRAWGNIGVTTSQQMLESELSVARFNIYEQIADVFCSEYCIAVY